MPKSIITTPFDAITYKIIGCAMTVHRQLGPGMREDSYQKALGNHFSDSGLAFEAERLYEVFDDPNQQIIGYLAVSMCPIGLLINFGERSLRYKRVFPPRKNTEYIINRQWLHVPDWIRDDV